MRKLVTIFLVVLCWPLISFSQGVTLSTYHDSAKKSLKEIYQVKDTVQNILHGRYISYFLNGNIESKGQFMNNETTGMWQFYYETGNLKMRGILRQNSNYGRWEYYFESGSKSMEGTIDDKNKIGEWKIYYESGDLKELGEYAVNKRDGLWKTYFEDGTLRGEIEYVDDYGRFIEYYHSGKVFAEGPRAGSRNVGHWRFFSEDGILSSEGDYTNGKKTGEWKFYYSTGKIASEGKYESDEPAGKWNYYFEDGSVSSTGEFVGGKKNGYWSSLSMDGKVKSEITYNLGSGEYREYYDDGKLKVKGSIADGKNQGHWQYFFQDGKTEGECQFVNGKGTYRGFYPNGTLQTKGQIEDDMRVGTWDLYEQDGTLSGYYKPFYENKALVSDINSLINQSKTPAPASRIVKKGFYYFTPRFPEYRGVILSTNPFSTFIGKIPLGIEFYNQTRLGHEFEFEGIRDPFYTADSDVAVNRIFRRGYSMAIKQKFYNSLPVGMWYFAHEVRFTNLGYFANVSKTKTPVLLTASSSEQRFEYGVLLGARLMQKNNGNGFTMDALIGYGMGYRYSDVEPIFEDVFRSLNTNPFAHTFRFGLTFGYSMSFDGSR
ncbi:MAG: hypothetical protein JJE09_03940 [Bacteroidia bacterium]|nr:hypothetical protein [Bacteroidia bacterium]